MKTLISVGVITTILLIKFTDFKNEMNTGNLIDFIGILVNVGLAWYITKYLQNKLNNSRAHKDYLINIISEYRIEYDIFFKKLFKNELNPKEMLLWFKMMTINIENLKEVENNNIYDTLLSEHLKLRKIITDSNDFNNQFNNTNLIISLSLKTTLIPINKELKRIKLNCVKLINNS